MSFKINFVIRLQHWMDSVPGQTFLNYAYSWGASIVILGTLFKLTHLPGANLMLFLGMGTEVIVFFLSAFDRPFDHTEEGKELPNRYLTDEEILAQMNAKNQGSNYNSANVHGQNNNENTGIENENGNNAGRPIFAGNSGDGTSSINTGNNGGGGGSTIIIGNTGTTNQTPEGSKPITTAEKIETLSKTTDVNNLTNSDNTTDNASKLAEIISLANDELLRRAQAALSPDMEKATKDYIEKMQHLTNTIEKVEQQSSRLTHNSEEMESLNRTLTGISTVYELQLKGVSSQVNTIDKISDQTQRMASQIEELNKVYNRMIKALTINMRNSSGTAPEL